MEYFEGKTVVLELDGSLLIVEPCEHRGTVLLKRVPDTLKESVQKKMLAIKKCTLPRGPSVGEAATLSSTAQVVTTLEQLAPHVKKTPAHAAEGSVRDRNKAALKKLLLLALRRVGLSTLSPDFSPTWKQMYCASVFALRKELDKAVLGQAEIINVIQSNMKAFNIN